MFFWSLFVFLSFFSWPICFLLFKLRRLVIPVISSHFSYLPVLRVLHLTLPGKPSIIIIIHELEMVSGSIRVVLYSWLSWYHQIIILYYDLYGFKFKNTTSTCIGDSLTQVGRYIYSLYSSASLVCALGSICGKKRLKIQWNNYY